MYCKQNKNICNYIDITIGGGNSKYRQINSEATLSLNETNKNRKIFFIPISFNYVSCDDVDRIGNPPGIRGEYNASLWS